MPNKQLEKLTEPALPWAIVDTKQQKILGRFESQAFAKVALDACSARLSAYRDLMTISYVGDEK